MSLHDEIMRIRETIPKQQAEPVAQPDLLDAVEAYLEAQGALDNRELMGPNAEPHEVLNRRRRDAYAALDDAIIAAKKQAAQPVAPAGWKPADDVVGYVARWGGNCRDCADEDGVCPNTGLPCRGYQRPSSTSSRRFSMACGTATSATQSPPPPLRRCPAMSDQPEALQLADRLDRYAMTFDASPAINVAAAELRRQHAAIAERDERIQALEAKRDAYQHSATWCEKHKPNGGQRAMCLVCACQSLSAALSRISYLCGDPSEMECGVYDVHADESAVVAQVAAVLAEVQALRPDAALPPKYMLAKLQMVMPVFQEARDALTELTETQRKLHRIAPDLANRMDAAGTFSLDDWNAARTGGSHV